MPQMLPSAQQLGMHKPQIVAVSGCAKNHKSGLTMARSGKESWASRLYKDGWWLSAKLLMNFVRLLHE